MKYRSEVDGLRTVAVLPVILFHAGFEAFSGGFVGVDVFYVLSGYLITSIIVAERADNRFSILRFYERRARRILPALFFVMAVCIPVAFASMLPDEFRNFSRTVVSVLLFSSNLYFWKSADYFAPDSEDNPLLHTWSLAVEEQYYMLFPLLVLLLWRFGLRGVTLGIAVATVGSLGLAEIGWRLKPEAAFYLLPTRAWELGLGSLAALYLFRRTPRFPPAVAQAGGALGVAMILASVAWFNTATPFPSLYALLPTVGTVLVILFAGPATLAGRLLALRPMVFLGLISYSAYLWHQPLFAFARIISPTLPSPILMLTLAALALVLATVTWHYVERPFRDRAAVGAPMILRAGLGTGVALMAAAVVLPSLVRSPASYPPHVRQLMVSNSARVGYVTDAYQAETQRPFTDSAQKKLLLIGDSYSEDFYNMIRETGAFEGYQIAAKYIFARCQVYLGPRDVSEFVDPEIRGECRNSTRAEDTLELASQADVIVFVASWRPWAVELLPETLANYHFRPDQRVLVLGRKNFGEQNLRRLTDAAPGELAALRVETEAEHQETTALMRRLLPPEIFVDTHAIVCGDGPTCPLFTPKGELISHDGGHLTQAGARYLGTLLFRDPHFADYAGHPKG